MPTRNRIRARYRCVRRGTWRPAALLATDRKALYAVLIAQPAIRGLTHATGDRATPPTYLDAWLATWFTAAAYLAGAAILATGCVLAAHKIVWVGHVWLATCYAVLATVLVCATIATGDLAGATHAAAYLAVIAIHVLMALRTGPRPLPEGVDRGEAVRRVPN